VSAKTTGITITEDYELNTCNLPVRLMLMALSPNALDHLHFDKHQLDASVEDISDRLDPVLHKMWGQKMYRIVLTAKSTKQKNQIKYMIK
jgi:hypothetical protein